MSENKYVVERSTTIDAPADRIYEHLADFHNWTAWSPWEALDPSMERSYSGAEAGLGAVYSWSGNRKAGQGSMKIVDANRPSEVGIDLVFEKPWKSRNDTRFHLAPQGDQTQVTWTMTGEKSLFTRVMGIFTSMDKMIGPDFEKGLARLKTITEQPAA